MEMPLIVDLNHAAVVTPAPAVAPATMRSKVLVAVASPIVRARIEDWLLDLGYEVVLADSGPQAARLLTGIDAPSIALLDDQLPGLAGGEVIRRVRAASRDRYVYALLLVDGLTREAMMAGREAGADDCLTWPLAPRELETYLRGADRIVALERRLAEARDRFRAQATLDPLTGLSNRAAIMESLDRELGRAERENGALAVVMVDLDHFKRINDVHGHLAGDEVIREAGRRMKAALRVYDVVGRYGGEEFIVVLPGADLATASTIAQRLRTTLSAQAIDTGETCLHVTASLGVAAVGGGVREPPEAIVRRADAALYEAKAAGRDQVVCAEPPRRLSVVPTDA